MIVIDGKAFPWQEVGYMLMTFDGFTLEARIKDTIDVVAESERGGRSPCVKNELASGN